MKRDEEDETGKRTLRRRVGEEEPEGFVRGKEEEIDKDDVLDVAIRPHEKGGFDVKTQRATLTVNCFALVRLRFRSRMGFAILAWKFKRPSKSILVERFYEWSEDHAGDRFRSLGKEAKCAKPKDGWVRLRLEREAREALASKSKIPTA